MLPTSKVDEVVAVRPDRCRNCLAPLDAEKSLGMSRHQVAEVPPIKAKVTEYQLHTVGCPCCATKTKAPLPSGVPTGRFGPALVALVAILSGRFKMSCRAIRDFLCLMGLKLGLGSVPQLQELASKAMEPPWTEIKGNVPKVNALNADDTAWRLKRAYLSVVCLVAPAWTLYQIVAKRDHKTLKEIFNGFGGVLGSDRASTYSFHKGLKQACLAHIDRLFQRFVDRGEGSRVVGKLCQAEMDRLWSAWHELCDKKIDQKSFAQKIWPIRARLAKYLKRGTYCEHSKTERSCARLLKRFGELWTFVSNEIEPTNNAAERALRLLVMLRRVSFGSKTDQGLRFVERVLTVVETCRRRGLNAWQFITTCIEANLSGRPTPSLLAAA
jgi:transposase